MAIMGPNGAGKSTVAGLAGGLVAIPVAILLSSVVLFDVVMQLLWWPFWHCIFLVPVLFGWWLLLLLRPMVVVLNQSMNCKRPNKQQEREIQ